MLNKYLNLSGIQEGRDFLKQYGRKTEIAKDDFFSHQGEIARYVGYIEKGGFRYLSYTSAGKPQIVGYSFKDDFVADYSSFQNQTKSVVDILAIEDCVIYTITRSELDQFYEKHHDIHLRSKFAETIFADIYTRLISLYCDTPQERYLKLLEQHPEMLNMVSLKEIASFIRVTPETLSRIRKNIVSPGK